MCASVTYGGGVTEFRGSIGGSVFSINHAGAYVRKKSYNIRPQRPQTAIKQSVFGYLCNYYKDFLTSGEKTAWETYASNTPLTNRLGETYYMTGMQAFIRTNVAHIQCGLAVTDTAPGTSGIGSPPVIDNADFVVDNSLNTFKGNEAWVDDYVGFGQDFFVEVYQCIPKPYGNTWVFSKPYLIGVAYFATEGHDYGNDSFTLHWPVPVGYVNGFRFKRLTAAYKVSNPTLSAKVIQA